MNTEFNPQDSKIGEILIHINKLSESQLQEALLKQKNTKKHISPVHIFQVRVLLSPHMKIVKH